MQRNVPIFSDLLEEVRRISVEWWAIPDHVIKYHSYTPHEQKHNDHRLQMVKKTFRRAISFKLLRKGRKDHNRVLRALSEAVGITVVWVALRVWSQLFLSKSDQVLSDAQSWYRFYGTVSSVLAHFHVWLERKTTLLSEKQKDKCVRVVALATVLGGLQGKADDVDSEALFSLALLVPLVDDFFDLEGDPSRRRQFAFLIKDIVAKGYSTVRDSEPVSAINLLHSEHVFAADNEDTFRKSVGTAELPATMAKNKGSNEPIPKGDGDSSIAVEKETYPPPNLENRLEELTSDSLRSILRRFDQYGTNSLLGTQILESLVDLELQKSPSDLLFSAACKGGFTLCLLQLIVTSTLQTSDISWLLRLGFALQLVDDLQDIHEDINDQNNTMATETVYASHDLLRQFSRTTNFIVHHTFSRSTEWHRHLSFEYGLQSVLTETLIMLCLEAAVTENIMNTDDLQKLLKHSPVTLDFIRAHPIEETLYKLQKLLL